MTHEFKKIVSSCQQAAIDGMSAVLASVVALEGSSYRRPGVRMLILENGKMIGAVSGGCVEKEILRQSESVFETGIPKVMTYDGRYRLGCEGILYILIEPFQPTTEWMDTFNACIRNRIAFGLVSYFEPKHGTSKQYGSQLLFDTKSLALRPDFKEDPNMDNFRETLTPCFKLLILGAEHDAVQLCSYAALSGWEVVVVATPTEEKQPTDFPGAQELIHTAPETLPTGTIDNQTAIILMTHSFVKDLKYLLAIKDSAPAYLGMLGPATRREKLLNAFLEQNPEVSDRFFDRIHGPAGLNIGAETPQEIAISVLAEILAEVRGQQPMRLKNKKGAIHR